MKTKPEKESVKKEWGMAKHPGRGVELLNAFDSLRQSLQTLDGRMAASEDFEKTLDRLQDLPQRLPIQQLVDAILPIAIEQVP